MARCCGGTCDEPPRVDAVTISKVRSLLYKAARLLGDVNAVENSKVPQRVERRIAGKFMGRILGKLFR